MTLRKRWAFGLLPALLAIAAELPKKEPPEPPESTSDTLYQTGKDLFDAFAPPEIKEQYEFPDKARWDEFAQRLQKALESDDISGLLKYEPEARAALAALETLPGNEEYIDWLKERLDYIEVAKQTIGQTPSPPQPALPPAPPDHTGQIIPLYDVWLQRLRNRPKPVGADRIVPRLIAIFDHVGIPAELVWMAEVESTFNPAARSPAGARGLFQLMPNTAKELGLRTFMPDERRDPEKSADAAAQMLRTLYKKFGDWPLALAAYNAGPGRVLRTLEQHQARTFAEISPTLPVETRMYVPKVLATLQVRAGVTLTGLAAPRI